jgi:GR25 family glycosyltransferase involved in LPS biosynthesis
MHKPAVFLIRISDNPISMWFAGRSYESWTKAGYGVQIVEAVTPETMGDDGIKINIAPIKKMGRQRRPFSETEKAIFYSHAKVLSIIARKTSPAIVIEHDAELIKPLPDDLNDMGIASLGCINGPGNRVSQTPALAYYIKPNIAKKLLEHLTTISCEGNVDAYINDYMKHYGTNNKYISHVNHMMDSTLGTTIEHPDIKG